MSWGDIGFVEYSCDSHATQITPITRFIQFINTAHSKPSH